MVALFIVSPQASSGKTALAIGLGRQLLSEGKKVGFLSPLVGEKASSGPAGDAAFARQALDLTEDVNLLSPSLDGGKALADRAREAYIEVSQNKDVVIVEGYCGPTPEDDNSKTAYEIARILKARAIVVENYARGKPAPQYADSYRGFGENLLGFILNRVPKRELKRTCEELTSRFSSAEMRILGILPEERSLVAFTVGELAEQINGELLNNGEKAIELGEISREEAEKVGEYLQRDIHEFAEHLNDTGAELRSWFYMDLELIEAKLVELMSQVADKTRVELTQLAVSARSPRLYRAGEISGPGTLQCRACGELIRFSKTDHISSCPKCHATEFIRSTDQQDT